MTACPAVPIPSTRAILHADLSGKSGVTLSFKHREYSDENDAMPSSFTGSVEADGVAISADGNTWYRVETLGLSDGDWRTVSIDLDQAIADAGSVTVGTSASSFSNTTISRSSQTAMLLMMSHSRSPVVVAVVAMITATHGRPQTLLPTNSSRVGVIEVNADQDFFRIELPNGGLLTVYSTGNTDTTGNLLAADGQELFFNDDGGSGPNFQISRSLSPGTYYVNVRGYGSRTGSYTVFAQLSGSSDRRPEVPGGPGSLPSLTSFNPFASSASYLLPFEGAIKHGTPPAFQYDGEIKLRFSKRVVGYCSGRVVYQGVNYSLRGQFDTSTGTMFAAPTRRGRPPLFVDLQFHSVSGASGYAITGTVQDSQGLISNLRLREAYLAGANPRQPHVPHPFGRQQSFVRAGGRRLWHDDDSFQREVSYVRFPRETVPDLPSPDTSSKVESSISIESSTIAEICTAGLAASCCFVMRST